MDRKAARPRATRRRREGTGLLASSRADHQRQQGPARRPRATGRRRRPAASVAVEGAGDRQRAPAGRRGPSAAGVVQRAPSADEGDEQGEGRPDEQEGERQGQVLAGPDAVGGQACHPGAGRCRQGGQRQRSLDRDLEQPQLGVVRLHLVDAGLLAGHGDGRRRPRPTSSSSTSNPWMCSSSSWSLVTVRVSVSPTREVDRRGRGVDRAPGDRDLEGAAGRARRRARGRRARGATDEVDEVDDGLDDVLVEAATGSSAPSPHPARASAAAAPRASAGGMRSGHVRGHLSSRTRSLNGAVCHDVRVPDRLNSLDASFLYLEESTTPMHVGSVMVFDPPSRRVRLRPAGAAHLDPHRLRAALPPADPPGPRSAGQPGLGRRRGLRHHLPRAPVGAAQARAPTSSCRSSSPGSSRGRSTGAGRCGRSTSSRGSRSGRFAIVTKSHQALVDGVNAVDIAHVIVDGDPAAEDLVTDTWRPSREPSDVELLTGALVDAVRRPSEVVENVRGGIIDVKAVGARALGCRRRRRVDAGPDGGPARARTPRSTRTIGEARRYVMIGTDLEDYRKVRGRAGAGQLRRRRVRSTTSCSRRSPAPSAPGC